MPQATDFHLKELLYESPSTRVLRALRQCDRRPVILKVLKEGDLAREHFERYQHEFGGEQGVRLTYHPMFVVARPRP